jgi:hypothetical protein
MTKLKEISQAIERQSVAGLSAGENYWDALARAAVGAMREPNDAMFDACETRSGAKMIFIRAEWRNMIDAILNPTK